MPKKVEESLPPYGQPQNLVKQTCRTLGITQKELAERIGASSGTVGNWSSAGDIPIWAEKSMHLLIENEEGRRLKELLSEAISLAMNKKI